MKFETLIDWDSTDLIPVENSESREIEMCKYCVCLPRYITIIGAGKYDICGKIEFHESGDVIDMNKYYEETINK